MAKIKIKNSVTSGLAPSGLSFGEMAVNITDRKIFIGNAVEGVVTLHDQNNIVTSVNGRTGAVQGVSAAFAGTGISVSGQTGNVTITNTGVVSFNGVTGDVLVKIEDLDVVTSNRIDNYVLFWDNDNELHEYQSVPTLLGNYVTTVNSATGAITNVAKTNTTQTFTQLQDFSAGISASAGSSFSNATVYITNANTNIDPLFVQHSSTGALKIATTGQARMGAIKLGNSTTSTFNTFINNSDGTLTFYNGISNTGSNMINFNTTTMNISPTIAGATFSGLIQSTSGISASGGITTASYVYAESGFRVGSGAINSQTGTTYTLLAADNGEIIVWNTSAGATLTIPSGLPVGFNATLIQTGTATIGITGSGTTLNSFEGKLRTAGQHAAVSIISYSSNVFNVAGGLTG